jgi:soluble lytic murein transglycosylase-like protein
MKRITTVLIVALMGLTSEKADSKSGTFQVPFYIYNAASQFNIDSALLYAFCKVESNCKSRAINHDDGTAAQKALGIVDKSYGLFQIKISTAKGLGFKTTEITYDTFYNKKGKVVKIKKIIDHRKDLLKPEINSYYAAKLIRKLYDKYGDDTLKVISAYNAGHPIKGNIDYVSKVSREYVKCKLDRKL